MGHWITKLQNLIHLLSLSQIRGHPLFHSSAVYTVHVLNVNEEPWTPDFAVCVNENTAGWACDCDANTENCEDWAGRRCLGGRVATGFAHSEPLGASLPEKVKMKR